MSQLELLSDAKLIVQNIEQVEKSMLELEQTYCPVYHRFGPGIYIREVHITKNNFTIGHYQKTTHLNVFLAGKVSMLDNTGEVHIVEAPMIFTSEPGRKIGFVHEDMVWLNIYSTDETDIEKLEATYLNKSTNWNDDYLNKKQMQKLKHQIDRNDYEALKKEYSLTEESIQNIVQNTSDLVDLPYGSYMIKKGMSSIHGTGIFATANFEAGELIAPARIKDKRTIAGRYTNHSIKPNAAMAYAPNGDIVLVATQNIQGCHGGMDGEEITVNYRQVLDLHKEDSCPQ